VGVQVFEAEVETDAVMRLRAAGANWARVRAMWKLIERERRTPPVYDWTVTDWLFGDTTAAGMRNVASVYANPPWAAPTECGPVADEHMDRYAALWTALVERYDGDGVDDAPNGALVRYWQVSNEPDFDPTVASDEGDYGGCFGHQPDAYAEHVAVAYRAAKAADPTVQVGIGPFAYDRFTAQSAPPGWSATPGPFVHDFAQRAMEHLHRAYPQDRDLPFFDFVGLHNYNDNGHFWDGPERPLQTELVGKVARFRSEQLALPAVYDVRALPIMVSETGLASSPSDEFTERSEALQAMYVTQTLVRALAADVLAVIWYTARDNIFGDCVPPHWDWLTFGLMRSDAYRQALTTRCPIHPWVDEYDLSLGPASPRPALQALSVLTERLAGTAFDRQLTAAETSDPAIEAYRFLEPGGGAVLAAWTTSGERLGRRGVEPAHARWSVTAEQVWPWSGRLRVTDHLGSYRQLGAADERAVEVLLGQEPVFVSSTP